VFDRLPLSTLLSQVLVAQTIELDNEFERRLAGSGGGARVTSVVMWSNFLRFVGDGITVDELLTKARLPRPRTLSTVGGMERWGYVGVGDETKTKRDGYGSARGLRGDLVVRPTAAGRAAAEIWPRLFGEIEGRWRDRFGVGAIDELRGSLEAFAERIEVELPEYVPIVDGKDGMAAGLSPLEKRVASVQSGPLTALLTQALLAYTIDFEGGSELSLALGENLVQVLEVDAIDVRDFPLAAGVPKEAISMALTFLTKNGYVTVEERRVRLTPRGREAREALRRRHGEVQNQWVARFGADDVRRLRTALERVLDDPQLPEGLRPRPDGWRATKRYLAHTEAMLDDPRRALPAYPMVLHRGGWPDGS
jgi:DNA-binding transcriptional ArsR family regulator